jgi:predicted  nucleic acid-binding Zn-ribbon protein
VEAEKKEKLALIQIGQEGDNKPRQLAEAKNTEMYEYINKLQAEKVVINDKLLAKEQEKLSLEIRINDIQIECESIAKQL